MSDNIEKLGNLGETAIIELIEGLIFEKTGKSLIRDDSLFFNLQTCFDNIKGPNLELVLNSDMLVSTTDVPEQMNPYQIGRKAGLMNISDLIVKGVKPRGIILSFGLHEETSVNFLRNIMNGLLDYISMYNMEYLGGDLNKTKELIINPTVFGVQESSKIIHRKGIKPGDILVSNERFGLTGVGFDILLHKKGKIEEYPDFRNSIESVLKPSDVGYEALIFAEENLATSSIDSSDGLAKSLRELMRSNPQIGFEVKFDENLIAQEAQEYSLRYDIPLESLIFEGGEEFIHLFTISATNFERAKRRVEQRGGKIYKIGHVISEERIFYKKDSERVEMKKKGYEHFD
ncbi:MAG: hypothetical protein GF383_01380 [Candidatus Lokiarchaeota archaeon]|nr:hypothetical protein [Candidatus Lokiarchaeota archaeon]